MRAFLLLGAAIAFAAFAATSASAQVVDPDIRGPARRAVGAAGEALGAPGVENRIERRQARRDLRRGDPDSWRMRYYNDEWWYYTPQNTWMYYRDNAWAPYDASAYRPQPPRYTTGYRGTTTSRLEPYARGERFSYGRPGAPRLTIEIRDRAFEPSTINVAPGTTVTWVNYSNKPHTVTAADGKWDSGEIDPDGTYSARFKEPGTYQYVCDLHKGMEGTIVVAEASGPTGATIENRDPEGQRRGRVDVDRRGDGDVDVDRGRGADVDVDVDRRGADVDIEARPDAIEETAPNRAPAPKPTPEPQPE